MSELGFIDPTYVPAITRVPMAARALLEILVQAAELCLLPQKLKVIRVPTTT